MSGTSEPREPSIRRKRDRSLRRAIEALRRRYPSLADDPQHLDEMRRLAALNRTSRQLERALGRSGPVGGLDNVRLVRELRAQGAEVRRIVERLERADRGHLGDVRPGEIAVQQMADAVREPRRRYLQQVQAAHARQAEAAPAPPAEPVLPSRGRRRRAPPAAGMVAEPSPATRHDPGAIGFRTPVGAIVTPNMLEPPSYHPDAPQYGRPDHPRRGGRAR